ncbi:MAG: hypothetical protein JSR90_15170 [Proteobacteria bacterium]|nr:hypothetical protein [Pseudomonadota bacterium]
MARPSPYRRAVLAMGPGAVDRQTLREMVEFARLLDLEMLGLFVEDETMLGLADLPFARELRLPDHAWHRFDAGRMAAELDAAAAEARRLFEQESAAHGLPRRFEIRRGDPAAVLGTLAATDILVVGEPESGAGMATTTITRVRRAALQSSATILILPPVAMVGSGPVALLAAGTSDPAFALASHVAAAVGEELVMVASPGDVSPAELVACFDRDLHRGHERLVVMARGASGLSEEAMLKLAAARCVPVLVIEAPGRKETPPGNDTASAGRRNPSR